MPKKMLIDATHAEETRVVVVEGKRPRKSLKGEVAGVVVPVRRPLKGLRPPRMK